MEIKKKKITAAIFFFYSDSVEATCRSLPSLSLLSLELFFSFLFFFFLFELHSASVIIGGLNGDLKGEKNRRGLKGK